MPARLTPNQQNRLTDLGRLSRRRAASSLDSMPSYANLAAGVEEGAWVSIAMIGGQRTLDHCVDKGYAEYRKEYGSRGGLFFGYRPTLQGWAWLARQERKETVAPSPAALTPPDPLCRHCKTPDSWHSEDDGQCPDDDGPHYHSAAAYDAREFEAAHAEGLHDDVPREFCPMCDDRRGRAGY